jgi:putative heme degradation protein
MTASWPNQKRTVVQFCNCSMQYTLVFTHGKFQRCHLQLPVEALPSIYTVYRETHHAIHKVYTVYRETHHAIHKVYTVYRETHHAIHKGTHGSL